MGKNRDKSKRNKPRPNKTRAKRGKAETRRRVPRRQRKRLVRPRKTTRRAKPSSQSRKRTAARVSRTDIKLYALFRREARRVAAAERREEKAAQELFTLLEKERKRVTAAERRERKREERRENEADREKERAAKEYADRRDILRNLLNDHLENPVSIFRGPGNTEHVTYNRWYDAKQAFLEDYGVEAWDNAMAWIGEELEIEAEGMHSIRSYRDSGPQADAA